MLAVETRHAVDPVTARGFGTEARRAAFALTGLFRPGEVRLVYAHDDRLLVGGVVPAGGALVLDHVRETGTASWLDRREAVIVGVGGTGEVVADGRTHALAKDEMLYLAKGSGPVTFRGDARFYVVSAPAHARLATRRVRPADARVQHLGEPAAANARTLHQMVHPEVVPSCQLVAGLTRLAPGSVWNTMPPHTHDRRSEVYLYVDLPAEARVVHLMGEPSHTAHLVLGNEEGALSPPWSIHAGCGTAAYAFVWAMAGDNVDFTDMDPAPLATLR